MPEKEVLIISSLAEPCTKRVVDEINSSIASVKVVFFEEAALSASWAFETDNMGDINNISIKNNNDIAYSECNDKYHSVWFRRWGYPVMPKSFSQKETAFAYGEFTALLSGIAACSNAKWVNPLDSERLASNKIHQLNVAKRLGAKIPETLITNNAEKVVDFKRRFRDVIFKPVSGATLNHYAHSKYAINALKHHENIALREQGQFSIFTQVLTDQHLEQISDVRWAPAIFQRQIMKSHELRITVVGQDIFACKIESQVSDVTAVDFRHMNTTGFVPHSTIDIPIRLKELILRIMRELRIDFGCFDFIVEKGTENYIFLEVNPSGQWLWIEDLTGAPISKSVAKLLLQ